PLLGSPPGVRRAARISDGSRRLPPGHLDDTFLSEVSGYEPFCALFSVSNQDTNADAAVVWAEGIISFTVISGPPDLSLTVSPICICALSAMLHSSHSQLSICLAADDFEHVGGGGLLLQRRDHRGDDVVPDRCAITGLMQCSKHQAGPFPWSVSCTCLSSALLTNSTESIVAPSWVRNCSIAS